MAWTNSKMFASYLVGTMNRSLLFDIDTDTMKAALYNNSNTPDNTVSAANSAYNVGQWAVGNEVSHVAHWAVAGQTIASVTVVAATTTITVDANDTASVDSATTLAANYGCLVYDDTIAAKNGFCYNYFGGAQQVTSGSYTIVWNGSGIASLSVA